MAHDLFISYARVDRVKIETLAGVLEKAGWTVWWDRQIIAGDAFDKVIETALQEARCVIVAWSERSIGSDWVRAEASFALERNKLVPVALDKSPPPLRFINTHTLDLSDWDGAVQHKACTRLITDLIDLIGPPGAPIERPIHIYKPDMRTDHGGVAMMGGGTLAVTLGPMGTIGLGRLLAFAGGALVALLVAAHLAYPRPMLSLFGANLGTIKTEVNHRLEGLRCATVTTEVSESALFRVHVNLVGFVSADADVKAATDAAQLHQVAQVTNALQVVAWPFCDMINLAETAVPPGQRQGAAKIDSDNSDMVFKDGDNLTLNVTASPVFEGYLYVDYIDADGSVAHMVPNKAHPDNKVAIGEVVKVGAAKGDGKTTEPAYEVGAPFGKRMIAATVARHRLFDKPRNQVETAAAYLDALRGAVAAAEKDDPGSALVTYRFITTQEK